MTRVAVLGGGSWGTALADHLARSGKDVVIWARDGEVVHAINSTHRSDGFLPGHDLAPILQSKT